jgi:3-isopropylmalate/(R)-2-methylmalate dehydratase small subunit
MVVIMTRHTGRAYVFGDNVNTDYIIASHRKKDIPDLEQLADYIMEDIRPGFGLRVKKGDIIVAGKNFGCGSAMEVASLAILAAGIPVVIAKTFARTFFRNGINGGLILLKCNTDSICDGDILNIEINPERTIVINNSNMKEIECDGIPVQLQNYLSEGGLIPYFNKYNSL